MEADGEGKCWVGNVTVDVLEFKTTVIRVNKGTCLDHQGSNLLKFLKTLETKWPVRNLFQLPLRPARIFKLLKRTRIDSNVSIPPTCVAWGGIFKLLWSPGIDSKESIPPAYVAWRDDNPSITRFLASIDCSKIPALAGRYDNSISTRFLALIDFSKFQHRDYLWKNSTIL